MAVGDSLEAAADYARAALEYRIVAELYPQTSFYPTAARRVAVLSLHPNNPSANDSVARYWFTQYLDVTSPSQGRSLAEVCLHLLNNLSGLQRELELQKSSNDSLASVLKKQSGELSTRMKAVQSLEEELKRAYEELRKLREVDVRISRDRGEK